MGTFTFTAANPVAPSARPDIAADVEIVQTAGYAVVGKGVADYVHEPAPTVGGAPVTTTDYRTANPRTSFIAKDGRLFRLSLDQVITPFMFGAQSGVFAGNTAALPDDSQELQAFFDFCAAHRIPSVNWGGVFGITASVIVGGAFYADQAAYTDTVTFDGALTLCVKSNIEGAALRVRARAGSTYGAIRVTSNDFYANHGARLFDVGVQVEDSAALSVFSYIEVGYARVCGLLAATGYRENHLGASPGPLERYSNTWHDHFESCYFYGCGSGSLHPNSFQKAGYSATLNTPPAGGSGGYQQRTVISVDSLPRTFPENYGIPIYVRVAGELSQVLGIDRAAGTVSVFPWINANAAASGSLEYIYGGGACFAGGDSSVMSGKLAATNCSTGLVNAALYNGYWTGTFQANLIGTSIGTGVGDAALGGALRGYFEGNTYDVLWNAAFFSPLAYYEIESQHALDISKIIQWDVRYIPGNGLAKKALYGLKLSMPNGTISFETSRSVEGRFDEAGIGFDRPSGSTISMRGDNNLLVVYPAPGSLLTTMFGYRSRIVYLTGTGPDHRPTGTLTVKPADPAMKINGGALGADAVFSGFTGPVVVQVEIDHSDPSNYLVSFPSGKAAAMPFLSATMQHATLGTGVQQSIAAASFTTLNLSAVVDNKSGFNNTSHIYTIPEAGLYECELNVRPVDAAAPTDTSWGIGIGTSNGDGAGFLWGALNASRSGLHNRVTRSFAQGDQVRAFAFCDVAISLNSAQLTVRRV